MVSGDVCVCVWKGYIKKTHERMQNKCFQPNKSLALHWVAFYYINTDRNKRGILNKKRLL